MQCPKCNTENREGAKFCLKCGASLALVCAKCGRELPPGALFCDACGVQVTAPPPEAVEEPGAPGLDKALQRLVPREFAERLLATRGQVSKERRTVTILFSDVKGSTAMAEKLDPEDWVEIMEGAFEVLIAPVYRYEGTLVRLLGDAILAFFGAPIAHEDDPERACRAALDIIEGAQRYAARLEEEQGIEGFNVRVGINTGLVVVGEVGSDLRVEYTAMGDAVNLAARMESAAEAGTVLITEATHKFIAPLFETEALGRIRVKGKAEPVPVYRLVGLRAEPGRVRGLETRGISSPLVGRDVEFAAVSGCIERLLAGQGGIVSIIGEAGVGKSRLMAEVRQQTPSVQWLEGRALSFGQTISYWPFQEILWRYAGITEDDSESVAWRKLESRVTTLFAENTAEILPYLATLLALEVRGEYAERVKYLDSEALGRQVFLASRWFFERLAQVQPVVLVFEDLHWVDESSALLLEHLLPLVERVSLLICGVSRPYRRTPAARLQEVAGQDFPGRYAEILLTPLSQADSAQLVHNLLEIEDLSSRVREMIVRKAEGNPFFLEEIIRALIDAGAVMHDPATGRWQATAQIETITIPDTIQGVIMARVDRLNEDVKGALRTAAVIGRSFLYRVLRAVAEAERQLDRHLAELQAVELIREKQRVPELEYIFKHVLAQEATYESILLQKRRELHAGVGQAVEALFADRLEEFYGLLAYHYARAEAWEKAQDYLLKAGDQAGRVAADAEALAHYRQALAAYARAFGDEWDPVQRAALERKMGEALFRRGEHQQALEHLQRALAHLGKPLPTSRWGGRLVILREIAQQISHRLLPRLLVKPMDEPVSPAVEEECRAYEAVGFIEGVANQERFLLVALRGLNVSERNGYRYGVAVGSMGLGVICDLLFVFWLAGGYHHQAVALAEQAQHAHATGLAYFGMGYHERHLGRWDTAIEHSRRAAEIFRETGDLRGWGLALDELALIYAAYKGDFNQALACSQDLVRYGQDGADLQVWCWGLSEQGLAQRRMGRLEEAIATLTRAIELAEAIPDYQRRVVVGAELGWCYLRLGELGRALAALEESQRLCVEHKARGWDLTPLRNGLAEAYLSAAEQRPIGKSERANWLKRARRACQAALKQGKAYRPGLPEAMRLQGTYEWLRGKPAAAQKWWQRSLALADGMGQRYDLGMSHLEMGQRLGERVHLERAEAILAEIGAEWDLARAREALRQAQVT